MPWYKRTPIDILVPFHGQYAALQSCIESIIRFTAVERYKITLIDDGSPNKIFLPNLLKNKLVAGVQLPEQTGFGSALAAGFNATTFPFVVFLNSDCLITQSHWLSNLRRTMEEVKKTGTKLISARMNNGGTGTYPEELLHPDGSESCDNLITIQPLPLVCCMVHRELFNKIGGFVKPYPIGWYEDEELYWRMKKKNYTQGISGKSWIKHEGGLTVNNVKPNLRKIMENNSHQCLLDMA